MRYLSKLNIFLLILVFFLIGACVGQSINLGWGLPLGTTLTLVVAVLGFGVAIYQSYSTRKHNRLLIKPHLIFCSTLDTIAREGFYTYVLKVKNVGLGPAIIKKCSVSFCSGEQLDGATVYDALVEKAKCVFNVVPSHCVSGFLFADQVLEKGEAKILVEISFPKNSFEFQQARNLFMEFARCINARINYRCHYGNKFGVSNKPASTTDLV